METETEYETTPNGSIIFSHLKNFYDYVLVVKDVHTDLDDDRVECNWIEDGKESVGTEWIRRSLLTPKLKSKRNGRIPTSHSISSSVTGGLSFVSPTTTGKRTTTKRKSDSIDDGDDGGSNSRPTTKRNNGSSLSTPKGTTAGVTPRSKTIIAVGAAVGDTSNTRLASSSNDTNLGLPLFSPDNAHTGRNNNNTTTKHRIRGKLLPLLVSSPQRGSLGLIRELNDDDNYNMPRRATTDHAGTTKGVATATTNTNDDGTKKQNRQAIAPANDAASAVRRAAPTVATVNASTTEDTQPEQPPPLGQQQQQQQPQPQPQPQQQLNDGGKNNHAFGSDAAQPQQQPTGGRNGSDAAQHSRYTTIHVQVPHEPLLPGNRMVIDLPAGQEEEGTVQFEITVPSNIEPGTIIPVQVPMQTIVVQPGGVAVDDADTDMDATWCEIGDPKAVKKTLQALREKRRDTDRQHEQQTTTNDDEEEKDDAGTTTTTTTTTTKKRKRNDLNITKTKKKDKKKDKNAPKSPSNPYNIFFAHIRPSVKEENPNASFSEISRIISRSWKAVDDRKEWNDKANKDKLRYKLEMSLYDENAFVADTTKTKTHLQEHMTYTQKNGKEKTTFIPEVKLARKNEQGKIVAGNYFKINDVPLHKVNIRADVYKLVLKKKPDEVNTLCRDAKFTEAWNNIIINTPPPQQQPQQQHANANGSDVTRDAKANGSDEMIQQQPQHDGWRIHDRAEGTLQQNNPESISTITDLDATITDVDAEVDVDDADADADADDTMALTEKLTKFNKSYAIIIYKHLLQAFGNKGIFIKCCGCESFHPISRYGIARYNLMGLTKYCRGCIMIHKRFQKFNHIWLFVARPVDITTTSGVDSSTMATTTSSLPAAATDPSGTTTASGVDSSTMATTAAAASDPSGTTRTSGVDSSTTSTTAAAASDPSGTTRTSGVDSSTTSTTAAAASDPSGTTTASGVDSTTPTPFLSWNYTWFEKKVPDNTPLNTSPGFSLEQYRTFCNMWKNEHGISVCHLCKMPETYPEQQIGMMDQLEYIIVDNSVVPAFVAGGGNNNHAANGTDAIQPQPQPQPQPQHQTNGGGNNNHATNGTNAIQPQPQPQHQTNGGGNNNHAANGTDAVQPQPQQQSNVGGKTGRNSEDIDLLRDMAVFPAFNAPSNIWIPHKFTKQTQTRQLSFDHHPYGMTDGEEDVSKAMLCSMLCSSCNLRLGQMEVMLREMGTLAYYYSVFSPEYISRVLEYIRLKNYYQLLINEWHKSIEDKDELCVSSCHLGKAIAKAARQHKIMKVCTDQLERLRKNNVKITKIPRANTTETWVGSTKGMFESKVGMIHIARRLTI